jgi:hypothetical protein
MVVATMMAPNNHESSAWSKTTRRMGFDSMSVSDT